MKHQGTKSPFFYSLSRSHVFNLRMRVRMYRVNNRATGKGVRRLQARLGTGRYLEAPTAR